MASWSNLKVVAVSESVEYQQPQVSRVFQRLLTEQKVIMWVALSPLGLMVTRLLLTVVAQV
jgi:hypothetical protein